MISPETPPRLKASTSEAEHQRTLDALMELIKVLTPLLPSERQRLIDCALRFFNEPVTRTPINRNNR